MLLVVECSHRWRSRYRFEFSGLMERKTIRDESKRKTDVSEKPTRRTKKRKLEKLVNWGMEEGEDDREGMEKALIVTD